MKQKQEESVIRRQEDTAAAKTTTRAPMPIKMRSKQFTMLDALKGLTVAITEKEKSYMPQRELSESRIEKINQQLQVLKTGDKVMVSYYCCYGRKHSTITERTVRIDSYWQERQVGDTVIDSSELDEIKRDEH